MSAVESEGVVLGDLHDAELPVAAPASDNPPPRSRAPAPAAEPASRKRRGASSQEVRSQGAPRKGASGQSSGGRRSEGSKAAPASAGGRKRGGRSSKPKGKS